VFVLFWVVCVYCIGEYSVDGFAMTALFQKPNHDFSTAAIVRTPYIGMLS
jgi:hypothetical protein